MRKLLSLAAVAVIVTAGGLRESAQAAEEKIKVLIIDGQNNHAWRSTTPVMKKALEDCGRFTVDVFSSGVKMELPPEAKDGSDAELARFKAALLKNYDDYAANLRRPAPKLTDYQVILSNYNGAPWPAEINKSLEESLKSGKIGLVIVHAADNSFGGWAEYNKMIGLGWRDKNFGERLKIDNNGKEVRVPKGQDESTGHRYSGPFTITVRDTEHPITKYMPREWMHNNDELYDNLRGPIENVHVLATAYSKGTKEHEPMIFTIDYGKGRVFHTPMGHDVNAMRCVGFVATLQRGTEWAATGKVTLQLPANFPTPDKVSTVPAK